MTNLLKEKLEKVKDDLNKDQTIGKKKESKKEEGESMDMVKEATAFATLLMASYAQIWQWHQQTKGFPQHETLGNLYEDLAECKDTLVEILQGHCRARISTLANFQLADYSLENLDKHLDVVEEKVFEFREKYKDCPGVLNKIDDLCSLILHYRYKFTLNFETNDQTGTD